MRRALWRLIIVALLVAGGVALDRRIGPPTGDDSALGSLTQSPAIPAPVALPPFATGFSVFVGEEAFDTTFTIDTAQLLDRLAADNVNSVALVFSLFQDGPDGSEVTTHPERTPSDAAIRFFIRAAHQRQIAVTLRPVLDEDNLRSVDRWRGQITPVDVDRWFETYGALIVHYATLAEEEQAAVVGVGVEFESMEQYGDHWRALIADVREVFHGLVTYSFNFAIQDLGFVDALDFIGLDAYYPLDAGTGASVDALTAAWSPWIEALEKLATESGKPVMLTEVGLRSQTNAFREPWKGHDNQQVSQEDQRDYYLALCNVISTAEVGANGGSLAPSAGATAGQALAAGEQVRLVGEPVTVQNRIWERVLQPTTGIIGFAPTADLTGRPVFAGVYVWLATIGALELDPATDQDYAVFHKLAEPVIAQCFADRRGLTS